jgi:hypothetical protein
VNADVPTHFLFDGMPLRNRVDRDMKHILCAC